jgi:hypothetical protein
MSILEFYALLCAQNISMITLSSSGVCLYFHLVVVGIAAQGLVSYPDPMFLSWGLSPVASRQV